MMEGTFKYERILKYIPAFAFCLGLIYYTGFFFAVDFKLIRYLNYVDFLMITITLTPLVFFVSDARKALTDSYQDVEEKIGWGHRFKYIITLGICFLVFQLLTYKPSTYFFTGFMVFALASDFVEHTRETNLRKKFNRSTRIYILLTGLASFLFLYGYSSPFSAISSTKNYYTFCTTVECKTMKLVLISNEYILFYDQKNKVFHIEKRDGVLNMTAITSRENTAIINFFGT